PLPLSDGGGGAGESHTLTCKISGLDFSDYPWSWVRKVPGKDFEFISYIGPSSTPKYYSPLLQERFTIARRDSSSQLDLNINSLKTEDTAAYFCARSTTIDISSKSHKKKKKKKFILYFEPILPSQ
uniref:Immunoglobulin heavy variable 6-1 n=1 Tax=Hippocampus comes TaxID=109280 RepID=A0A3Q2XH86_HIPCM